MPKEKTPHDISGDDFARYERLIGSLARDMFVKNEHVDDIVQETMSRVLEAWKPGGMKVTSFINMVGAGKIKDHLRSMRRGIQTVSLEQKAEHNRDNTDAMPEEEGPSPRTAIIQGDESRELRQMLDRLPKKDHDLVKLRYERGLEAEQIAERLGVNRREVYTALERIQRSMRRDLAFYYSTVLLDQDKMKVLMTAVEKLSKRYPLYIEPFMLVHVRRKEHSEAAKIRTKEEGLHVTEQAIASRLKMAYRVMRSEVGMQDWNKIKGLLGIEG